MENKNWHNEEINSMIKFKKKCDNFYHNKGKSLISDEEYDILTECIKIKYPEYKSSIGASVDNDLLKAKLPFNMGSMDKLKPENKNEIDRWLSKNKAAQYTIEPKLDGISCLLVVKNKKIKLYTRGDGNIGTDISPVLKFLTNIPSKDTPINIRGELIIKKSVFEKKYANKFSNARNFVSGVIMSKKVNTEYIADISFVPYEIIKKENLQDDTIKQIENLNKLGMKAIPYKIFKLINVETLVKVVHDYKQNLEYEVDGIIIQPVKKYTRNKTGNPSYSIAFKVQGSLYTTTVEDVIWKISKWGKIIPTICINTVDIKGVKISYTTGFNAKYVVSNQIGIGSVINITRSGDVIPYIVEVIKSSTNIKLPDVPYRWCENKVHFELVEECNTEKSVKMILSFFKGIGVKYLNIKTISKFYENGFDSIVKILEATNEDFMKIEGFNTTLANKIYNNIHSKNEISVSTILGSAGIFGVGINQKKIEKLFEEIPDLLKICKLLSKDECYERIVNIKGFSCKTTKPVVDNLEKAIFFVDNMKKYYTIRERETKINDNLSSLVLKDKKIVFTGFRDKELEQQLNKHGGKLTTSISKNTFILVVKEIGMDKKSSKYTKALKEGVTVMDKKSFIEKYFNN